MTLVGLWESVEESSWSEVVVAEVTVSVASVEKVMVLDKLEVVLCASVMEMGYLKMVSKAVVVESR